jgi:deazaflavin-dependent oxidoreductase (nitroreductase family)
MAKKYRYDIVRRIADRVSAWLIRRDLAPEGFFLLTVLGRKTGLPRTKPVAIVENGSDRWLVAPYGEVDWVLNAKAAGRVSLSRGGRTETLTIERASLEEGARVLKEYIGRYAITRPYFELHPDSPADDFLKEATWRPVFKLEPASNSNGQPSPSIESAQDN